MTKGDGVILTQEGADLVTPASVALDKGQGRRRPPTGVPADKAVIRRLFDCLEELDVNYCHWKSNIRLADTLAGREDIDLLVDPRCAALFHSALARCGYRPAVSRFGNRHPAVFHAIALDSSSGELVDLHAYHQIVSGDSLVKNYRFPIERAILSGSCRQDGVRVPDSSAELLLFVLRMALKHVNLIEILKVNRHYDKVVAELEWLQRRGDSVRAAELCAIWFPAIDRSLFARVEEAIAGNSLLRRVSAGWQVARRLRYLRRLGALRASTSRGWRLLLFMSSRLRRRRDLVLQSGGAIIALIGPKGTGKSTVGSHLARRLGRYLCTRQIHAGKPPASLVSFVPRLLVPVARLALPGQRLRVYQSEEGRASRDPSFVYVLRRLLVAYDRRRLLLRALREATAGAIVISDRYPSETPCAIDSNCFDDSTIETCRSRLKRWMMRREQGLYRGLPRPTVVLQLTADFELALQRDAERSKRGGPDPEAIRRRWQLESRLDFTSSPVVKVDATLPLSATVNRAVNAAWQNL
jgi:thymidylate kinase